MDKVRFGVIGAGNMGSQHCKWLAEGEIKDAVLAAVADTNPAKLAAQKEKWGDAVAYFSTADELFASGLCDAAIVATPHYFHPPLVIQGLQAGLHMLSEKPAGVYTKQVKEMNEAAQKSDKLFAIMFNQRTNTTFQKMQQLIAAGELGEIKRTSMIITNWYRPQSYYDSGAWRATWAGEGGGVLYNQAPHNLDLFQWITGMMPSRVRAFCHFGKWHNIEVEDDVTAYVEYPNGATGTFITSTADAPGTNRFEILGDKGRLIFDNGALSFRRLETPEREFNATYAGGFGEPKSDDVPLEIPPAPPQHPTVLANFAQAILGNEPLTISGVEGIKGVTLANAMHLSTWLDKAVELPFDDELFYTELQKRIAASDKTGKGEDKVLNVDGTYGGNKK